MLGQGMVDVAFKPIEFLANTISYSRLGIFLIMHSALMGLINNGWTYGVVGVPIVIFGNIFVMALEGFLVYIQDLRLHLYEWFTKFQEGEAKAFTPIKTESELLDVVFQ
jgi:V/A-type H+-transporting ATPase subunit I